MAKNPTQTAPAAPDEYAGHGGSYVVDGSGRRTRVSHTAPADATPATEPAAPETAPAQE